MNCFFEKLNKGYTFLQSFKSVSNNLSNKVNTFNTLLEGEASIWFHQNNFHDHETLEADFLKTCCVSLISSVALVCKGCLQ